MINRTVNLKFWLLVVIAFALSGCATTGGHEDMTSLEIQAFQKHEFEAPEKVVFGAVLSVFQDLGYIVESADRDTGFITAASASSNKTGFWEAMGHQSSSGKTRATAFIEKIREDLVTVRLNFVDTKNTSSQYGQQSSKDTAIVDPQVYQAAFDKIEEAVFIRIASD